MPSLQYPQLYLAVDGGGTSVKVVIASAAGAIVGRGSSGPCNVKSVGHKAAIDAILQATYEALTSMPDFTSMCPSEKCKMAHPPRMDRQVFARVWLGLAGLMHTSDIDAFAPHARQAFHIADADKDALRCTNDGHLLASPCMTLPHVDSTVVLVAGTGTVGLAFKKRAGELDLVAVSGGWGYLLGDEGSAYAISRLAIRYILGDDDARKSASLAQPVTCPVDPRLPLFDALLNYFRVKDAAELVHKAYTDHSTPEDRSFTAAETNRKVWMAEAARVVFAFAFDGHSDHKSRAAALEIVEEAGVRPLVKQAARLVGDKSIINPARASLSLGGGLWNAQGYCDMLRRGLKEQGIVFAETVVVKNAPEEGAKALALHALSGGKPRS